MQEEREKEKEIEERQSVDLIRQLQLEETKMLQMQLRKISKTDERINTTLSEQIPEVKKIVRFNDKKLFASNLGCKS